MEKVFIVSWDCVDCKKDCSIDDGDEYMVRDPLWDKYGVGEKMLCFDCFQKRLGRKLVKNDMTKCPLNEENMILQRLDKK